MEKVLNKLGITSFKQVANFNKKDIAKVTDAIAERNTVRRPSRLLV